MIPDTLLKLRSRSRIASAAVAAVLALLPFAGSASESAKVTFSEGEIKRILSHGPWPIPAKADASNRASGHQDAIVLGAAIFFDPRLSASGQMACSNCHVPERNWTDNLRRGVGAVEVDRNTPSLMNLRAARWFGWDGAADSLWSQNLRPMLDRRELGSTPQHVAKLVRDDKLLACRYTKAFGAPPADDESVFVGVGKSIAAFLETLVSGRTPFDRFRDALARGDSPSEWNFSEPAQRGLKIFVGKGECTTCHTGPNFTGEEFFNTGLSRHAPRGRPDAGREAGIKQVLASRYNLQGKYNDDPTGASAEHLRKAAHEKAAPGEFKVPSLRNLLLTAPYGRDGRVETVAEVVRHYAELDPASLRDKTSAKGAKPAKPLNLTPREQTDLVVFLETLSSFSNPWRPDDNGRCD